MERLTFFLGGHDLEMLTIRQLLERHAPGHCHDKGLRWGAKASAYRAEIEAALGRGETPVLVELEDDLGLADKAVVVVDHHGPRSGGDRPTSLHQVFDLLGLGPDDWTHDLELVAANDRGYIPGLVAAGANREEIRRLRAADRAAQGVTLDTEVEAERAARLAEPLCDGRLTLARMTSPSLAAVEDRLHAALGGPGVENLLLLGPSEANFSGEGRIVLELAERFPGGYWGGALPARGFWGRKGEPEGVEQAVIALLTPDRSPRGDDADPSSSGQERR